MSDLCSLADVRAFLGIPSGSTSTDGVLSALVTNASAAIESFCNRTFATASYTEQRNGTGGNRLFLAHGPVAAVASVSVDGQAIPAASGTGEGFLFDETTVYLRGYTICRGVQNVTVTYTAGFAAVPGDVAQACIEWVAYHYAKRDRMDKASETLGTQQTVSFSQADMPAAVKTALKQRIWWASP